MTTLIFSFRECRLFSDRKTYALEDKSKRLAAGSIFTRVYHMYEGCYAFTHLNALLAHEKVLLEIPKRCASIEGATFGRLCFYKNFQVESNLIFLGPLARLGRWWKIHFISQAVFAFKGTFLKRWLWLMRNERKQFYKMDLLLRWPLDNKKESQVTSIQSQGIFQDDMKRPFSTVILSHYQIAYL